MKKIIFFGDSPMSDSMILDGFEPIRENIIHAHSLDNLVQVLKDLINEPKIIIMDMREDRAYEEAIRDVVKTTKAHLNFVQSNPVVMISSSGFHAKGLGVVGTVTSRESYPDQYKPSSSLLTRILQHVMNDETVLDQKRFREAKQFASEAVVAQSRRTKRSNTL